MAQRTLLGMLTPSSNTVLEPVTTAIVSNLPEVSVHFSRFRVTEISLSQDALQQFELDKLLLSAQLLADANVDVIAWNGTSAGWLGFESDVKLCQQITTHTGIPSTTSILALLEILKDQQITKIGLVTPYLTTVQAKIIDNFAAEGFHCVAERHLQLCNNFSFSEVPPSQIISMVTEVAAQKPQAILTFCTNLRAAPLVKNLEQEIGIPIYDTISVAVWKSLKLAGINPSRVSEWGSLFSETSQAETSQVAAIQQS